MKYIFQVENIRCGGCENTITKKLKEISGIKDVQVNIDDKQVIVTTHPNIDTKIRQAIGEKLIRLGYPEVGTAQSNNLKTKATSVVSCVIGKVSDKS